MKRMATILIFLTLIYSIGYAAEYVYVIPYRYRMPSILYSYDYYYRTQPNAYYDSSLYGRGYVIPPIYHLLDDDDDDHGYLIDPSGGVWFYYKGD